MIGSRIYSTLRLTQCPFYTIFIYGTSVQFTKSIELKYYLRTIAVCAWLLPYPLFYNLQHNFIAAKRIQGKRRVIERIDGSANNRNIVLFDIVH